MVKWLFFLLLTILLTISLTNLLTIMDQKNKLLNLTREYFRLPAEEDLAAHLGINYYDLECMRNSNQPLSVEIRLTILSSFLEKADKLDCINEPNLLDKIDSGYLFNSLCSLYSLDFSGFSKNTDWSDDACFIEALRMIVVKDPISFNDKTVDENICLFLRVTPIELRRIENGTDRLGLISKFQILNWIDNRENSRLNPSNEYIPNDPFHSSHYLEMIASDDWLIRDLITCCLEKAVLDVSKKNQINDSEILVTTKKVLGLKDNAELAELIGSTTKSIESINSNDIELTIYERINLILRVIDNDDLRQCITVQNIKNKIIKLEQSKNQKLTIADIVCKYKKWNAKEVINRLRVDKNELLSIPDSASTISDVSALTRLKIFCAVVGKIPSEFELAIKSNSYLLTVIESHRKYEEKRKHQAPAKQTRPSYNPTGLNRLFWLAAKGIAVPDPEFSPKDNVRFAMGLYSGAYVNHIRLSDMVDCVINALDHYYEHVGTRAHELHELFNPLRTDYAALTNQKWNQDQASEKIINACMSRLMLAQVRDGDRLLVDLSGPDVNYNEVWGKVHRKEAREETEETARIYQKCRCDGEAKCLRMFNLEWRRNVTDEEKQNMKLDECLCENSASRPMSFECDFDIEQGATEKPVLTLR